MLLSYKKMRLKLCKTLDELRINNFNECYTISERKSMFLYHMLNLANNICVYVNK